MNDDTQVREAARERLFDAALVDAVAAERAAPAGVHSGAERPGRIARVLQAALLLLGVCVTVAVLVLRDRGEAAAQDPDPFDPVFPRIENEWLWGPPGVQFHTQAQLDALPEHGPAFAIAYSQEAVDRLAQQPGVRRLHLAMMAEDLDAETWRRIGRMGDLEMLDILCSVTAADLRELRHAPRLRDVMFSKPRFVFDEALATSLVELPHLSCVQFALTTVRPDALARLAGLPHLKALYFQSRDVGPDWLAALSRIRTLRWLSINVDTGQGSTTAVLTAADLGQLGALRALRSLALSNVSIAEADLELLPKSVEVLALAAAEPLTEAGLRTLLARSNLRGLRLRRVDAGLEHVLCELLPRTRLERFACWPVTERLWQTLEQMQTLRWLGIATSGDVATNLSHCARLEALEQINLTHGGTGFDLSVLRSLQRLRRISVLSDGNLRLSATELGAMQASLGPGVELVVRH